MNFCIMIFKSHPGSWYGCTHDEGKIKESEWRSPPKSEASANTRITLTRNIRRYFLRTDTEKVKMQLHMFEFEIQCCARRSLWGRSRENFAEIYVSNNNNDLYDRYIRKWEDSADTVNIFLQISEVTIDGSYIAYDITTYRSAENCFDYSSGNWNLVIRQSSILCRTDSVSGSPAELSYKTTAAIARSFAAAVNTRWPKT